MRSKRDIMENRRKTLLAKVHIAKKELGLNDEEYRSVLYQLFQKDSARDLNINELIRLVNTFIACGWKPRSKKRLPKGKEKLLKKCWAICSDMALPYGYADGIAKNMFGIEKLIWCAPGQIHKVVAALEYHKRRNHAKKRDNKNKNIGRITEGGGEE